MNRLIIAIMGLVLVSFAIAATPNLLVGYVGGAAGNASIITPSVNGSYSNTAVSQAVYAAESYLQSRLGQSYYNAHVSYYGAESYGNSSYVYFTYLAPFSNGTSALNVTGMQYTARHLLGITLFLNGTKVTGYIGPAKPYVISVSRTQALNISQGNGLENGNATIEGVFNSSNIGRNSTYSIAWAVLSRNPLKSGIYQGIYIDAESGNVVGEYNYNPLVAASQLGSAYAYGTSGNFSMFYMQNQTQVGSQNQNSNPTDSQYIIPLIILAFLILGIGLYISRRER